MPVERSYVKTITTKQGKIREQSNKKHAKVAGSNTAVRYLL